VNIHELRAFTLCALLGGAAFWPAACASARFASESRATHRLKPQSGPIEEERSLVARSQPVRVAPPSPLRLRVAGTGGLLYEVTAYSHGCIMPNGPEGPARRAADGRWPRTDHTIAADTSLHPFGSELLIDGVGLRTVGDRGSAIKGRKVDLFVDSCTEARRFGRRWLRVRVPKATTEEAAQ